MIRRDRTGQDERERREGGEMRSQMLSVENNKQHYEQY